MAKSKAARAQTQVATLKRKNEAMSKTVSAVKKAAKSEAAQQVTMAALSGGAGALAGKYLQEYLNKGALKAGPDQDGKYGFSAVIGMDPKVPGSGVPTGVFIGAAVAAVGLAALKGDQRAVLGGLGAGVAGGSYLIGPPVKA